LRCNQPETPCQLRRRQAARQLKQRQWITVRLRDDPITHSLIQHKTHRRSQQRAGVAVAQALDVQLRDVLKLVARLTRGEHDPNRLSKETPGDKGQRQRGGLIQPLRVIDDAQQRALLRHLREQA
jgi:hypothetical protein